MATSVYETIRIWCARRRDFVQLKVLVEIDTKAVAVKLGERAAKNRFGNAHVLAGAVRVRTVTEEIKA